MNLRYFFFYFFFFRLVQCLFRHGDRSPLINPFKSTKLETITDNYWKSEVFLSF